jgi:hypothetical protein
MRLILRSKKLRLDIQSVAFPARSPRMSSTGCTSNSDNSPAVENQVNGFSARARSLLVTPSSERRRAEGMGTARR